MLPDIITPVQCPTCGAGKSHDVRQLDTLVLLGRVYECGAAVSVSLRGHVYPALTCPKAAEIIAQLRADNARLGAMNVAMAAELQAIADAAEEALGEWLPVVIDRLPFDDLILARTVLDLATEALEGRAPAAAESEKVTA